MTEIAKLLDAPTMQRILTRVAHEIAERNAQSNEVVLVGIQKSGVPLARRLAALLEIIWGHPVPTGALDISLHRDDLDHRAAPQLHPTEIPCDINGRSVVLVDDVLFSGRTIRAAMDALTDFGRASRIQLAVLVDRGHRELPIRPDFVGKNISTAPGERVKVELKELHGRDQVTLERE
jgi:pyrimidine operon attenuation protein / uracil phosphoribosyltransferase